LAAAWAAWLGSSRPPSKTAADPGLADPRLTFATLYRNVRPEVRYVGDAACLHCHADKVKSYHGHPMSHSVVPIQGVPLPRSKDGRSSFRAEGWEYRVAAQGGRVFHKEVLRGPQGNKVAAVSRQIAYVLGSGRRGHSYLTEQDGFLFQSPISWFSQKRIWDLSPGYAGSNYHFERRISADCLFCHSNHVRPVAGTLNRYETPVFQGYGISCERCHGPGDLHVRLRDSSVKIQGLDETIVNPADLRPALRDAVCEQCHLVGERRVLRAGRRPFDFRPGLPLHLFVSVFVAPPERAQEKAVGHVEQMHASRCFRKSGGKLSCFSCHNPHELPREDRKAVYYRKRCLKCHGSADQPSCRLDLQLRQRQNADNCIACHMPRYNTAEVAHTAGTDHRIPRHPGTGVSDAAQRAGQPRLVNFYRDRWPDDDPAANRDLGVALGMVGIRDHLPAFGAQAVPLLDDALEIWPNDVDALEAKGYALFVQKQYRDAVATFGQVLARNPRHENALAESATLSGILGHTREAISFWKKAIAVSPYISQYHHSLAAMYARRDEWDAAAHSCQEALRLNPARPDSRALLMAAYLHTGRENRARVEFEKLLILKPDQREQIEQWFQDQAREARPP
jgi:tetratricopeptide (TPR) repeat protein